MPIYQRNGKTYTIPEDEVEGFEKTYPDATQKYVANGRNYNIPVSEKSGFISTYKDAIPFYKEINADTHLKTDIPVSRFVQGKGEDTTIFGVPYSIYTQMKPESQSHYYQKALDEEKELKRQQMEEQALSIKGKAGEQHVSAMGDKVQADYDAVINNPFIAINDPVMGVEMKTPDQTKSQKKVELTRAASERADDTLNMIEETGRKGNTSFVSGFGRGFWERVSKTSTWDFGGRDMQANLAISSAAKKYEAGQTLSDEEENLLDAVALEAAASGELSGDLGRGYKAGGTTAESLPFMAEFMINPATGTGKAVSKAATKKIVTNFGKEAAKSTIGKIARNSVRVGGDIAGAGIMTGTTGAMRTASDAVDRMNGNVSLVVDADGYYRFGGTDGGEGVWESLAKAYGASTIENFSEMFGNYLAPIGGAFAASTGKAMNKIGLGRVNRVIGDIKSSDVAKIIDDFQSKTQWNGTIGEYLEEQAGMAMNALTVGDNNLSDMFDPNVQIDTFLGVSALGGLFSGVKTAGYAREKYSAKNKLNEAARFASGVMNNSKEWMDLKEQVDEADDSELVYILSGVMKDEQLADEAKQAVLVYAGRLKTYHGASLADLKRKTEGDTPDEVVKSQMNFDEGYRLAEADRNGKRKAFREMSEAEKELDDEFLSGDENLQYDLMKQRAESGEDVSYELAYINAWSRFDGMIQGIRDGIDEKVARSNEHITNVTHKDGNVYDITLSSDENKHVFPVSGNLVFDENGIVDRKQSDARFIVHDDTGKVEMRSVDDLYKLEASDNGEYLKEVTAQTIREQESARYAEEIETPSEEENAEVVASFHPGDVVSLNMQGIKATATVQSKRDGSTVLQLDDPIEYGGEKVQVVELSDEQLKTIIIPEQKNSSNMIDIGDKNESLSPMEESKLIDTPINVEPVADVPVQEQTTAASVEVDGSQENRTVFIPVDKKGNKLYHKASVETSLKDIRSFGLDEAETDEFVGAQKIEASKRFEKLQKSKPKVGINLEKYQMDKKAWADEMADAQAQSEYWNELEEQVLATRKKPGDTTAEEITSMGDPMNGNELAAMMLGNGKLPLLYSDYKKETGFKDKEAGGMFGTFASKENGGLTIEQAGEKLMLADMEAGTNYFDQEDANAGRNAILDVLSSARTRGDLTGYISKGREAMAERERQAEYEAYERWCDEGYHMIPEEYETYEGEITEDLAKRSLPEEEYNEFMSTFVDEQKMNSNGQQRITGESETSSEVLHDEEFIQTGRAGGIEEESPEVDGGIVSEDGVVSEGSSGGEINSFGEIYSQFKGKAKEAIAFEKEALSSIDKTTDTGENRNNLQSDSTLLQDVSYSSGSKDSEEPENKQVNSEFIAPSHMEGESLLDYAERVNGAHVLHQEEKKVNTAPTDTQKEAGNYKKGHVKIDGYNITIENPKGSERSGVDVSGKPWSITMNNTYGYIRGTEGVDGDHIDVFLSDDPTRGDVYVIDQINEDGSFDEHKVMYGFGSMEEARVSYLANYSPGWKGLGGITGVSKEAFKEWIDSSRRKTKPFAEYGIAQESNAESGMVEEEYHPKDDDPILYTHSGELPLKEGEFCHVERIFTESNAFSFTGKDKIESTDDVAYIFRELENVSVENSFVVLVKDKKPTVVHLGMGAFTSTVVNSAAIKAAYNAVGADEIYFVHNHPSGVLKCSREDIGILGNIVNMFESEEVVVRDGIIIDTTSGEYGTFNLEGDSEMSKRPDKQDEVSLKLYTFDRLVFSKDYDANNLSIIRSSEDIAALVSSQRLGKRKKVSYMILDNAGRVLGNLHTTFSSVKRYENALADDIARNVIRFGGTSAVVYGNFDMMKFSPGALNGKIRKLSAGNVRLLDCVSVGGMNTRSAVDDNLMEPESVYGVGEIEPTYENERKRSGENENIFDSAERIVEQERVNKNYDNALNAINEFSEKCAGACRTLVVKSKDSLREQMEVLHIEDEDIDKYERWMNEGKTSAFYSGRYERIFVLDTDVTKEELNAYLWHENIHKALKDLYGNNMQEYIDKVYDDLSMYTKEDFNEIIGLYSDRSEAEQREECIVWFVEDLYRIYGDDFYSNFIEKINKKNLLSTKNVLTEIYNIVVYGTERKEVGKYVRERSGREIDGGVSKWNEKIDGGTQKEERGGEALEMRNSDGNIRSEEESRGGWIDLRSILESGEERLRRKDKRESDNSGVEDPSTNRDGNPEIHERVYARDRYERRVRSGMYQTQEALQDSMLGLKEAMDAILKAEGTDKYIEDISGFENAYLGENSLSSVNKAEADAFAHTIFKPMLDEVANFAKNEDERWNLTDYMMAKHGLERNTKMAERDAQEEVKAGSTESFDDILAKYRQKDYSGLTALTGIGEVADAEEEARRMVDDYERGNDTTELWTKVHAVSNAILEKSYQSGMMSKATYKKVKEMYEFYIPLRGFDEKTSDEVYAYLSSKQSAFNAPIKNTKGRKSKADDPFANLESMAESAIMQGNRNRLVKQRFLNFALNHPSDLVSVSDLWLAYDKTSDEWKPVFPDNIVDTDTPGEVEKKMKDFEEKMEKLSEKYPDQYKNGKDAENIPYRVVESRDLRQHQIVVKCSTRDYVVTINGNPRAAQAINGQTNPDNDLSGSIGAILKVGEMVNRQLSAFYTTRNPDFVVSNFIRDMIYSNTMAWVKETPNYALRFNRNFAMMNPAKMKMLFSKYRKGEIAMNDATERMFHQFIINGGETGYANVRDIEQRKNDIRRELKRSNGKLKIGRAISLLGERLDEYNRAVENCARFSAFVTSREMGRSIDRSIYDAKEISVNFNKKGSGSKFMGETGQTAVGNVSAFVSGIGRIGYVFWNAAIQGSANFGRQFKRHPAKAFIGAAAMFTLGAIMAGLGGDDDEDDKNAYYNLPEHVRRSNILFRIGGQWISIPLSVEFRGFYGMGELMMSILNGKEHLTGGEIAEAIAGQVSQVLPIDLMEGGGNVTAFIPSAAKPIYEAYVSEKGWTGMPLYKDSPYNKDMPEWTKAYKSANKYIVNLCAVLNEVKMPWQTEFERGDEYTKGAIDLNPSKIEYMLNGYFGGVSSTIDKLSKMTETIAGQREYDPRSFLLLNRIVKNGDESTEYRAVNNEYFRLKDEHDNLKSRLKHYEEDTYNDIFDYAEKVDFLYNSPEYERYEIFENYKGDINALYEELKEIVDEDERKVAESELNIIKKEMIDEMNLTRKRK
ncbi:LPD38 domain-containing protein [Bacteroides sp.]|uniref:LPD38 domain-containing protein n=1 Tax=Bacteroides sp. TaxID=29523 RepID=UPI00261E14FB|nr:LPD38 domain-containing protein [Bacteroides sp.]MDD3037158.1 JAB domain-containing protein [Bacteroides sp.]